MKSGTKTIPSCLEWRLLTISCTVVRDSRVIVFPRYRLTAHQTATELTLNYPDFVNSRANVERSLVEGKAVLSKFSPYQEAGKLGERA